MILRAISGLVAVLVAVLMAASLHAAPTGPDVTRAIDRGTDYLVRSQQADGSWEDHAGITAVVVLALLPATDPSSPSAMAARRGLAYLERWVRPDGGIYQEDVKYYSTAVGLLAFAASGEARYRDRILGARGYLMKLQAREENGFTETSPLYGGTMVDVDKANLDATFFAMRALAESGLRRDDPYWARALRFVSRCQNAKATNDQAWAGSDGGFIFAPGFSFAGGTTSYGSMTYAGLSALRDAGLARGDARVDAAFRWVGARFTTDENPGLQKQTLYHSYFYMSQTLQRWGVTALTDPSGRSRVWREEVATALLGRQQPDGSWVNSEDPRWFESRPVLATSFSIRTLKTATLP